MDEREDREEGVPPSKSTLCEEQEIQPKAQSSHQRAEPSCVSLRSSHSKQYDITFKEEASAVESYHQRPDPSSVSLQSSHSKQYDIIFKEEASVVERVDQETLEVPSGRSEQQHQTHLDSIFVLLEDSIVTYVKNELKKIQKVLTPDYPEFLESQREDEEMLESEDEEQRRSSREALVKITLFFLRRMKQEELADHLQSSKRMRLKIHAV
ncbi:uncharacterized protein LOC121812258 [Haplochromis burtoni]|uniref:uncharacterized protein LOC121812258 n=1 Tax=Haplochromis burtoni TaxID=8153 RepID=UPI001C2D9ABB|nr:uncharacterized protein LOC121812258 [Haplochromis burtoni]